MTEEGCTVITGDQKNKSLETRQRHGWFRVGSNPTVEVTGSRDNLTVLGAFTHGGETFHCWTEETLPADHGVMFLRTINVEFSDDLVILLEQPPYFYAKDVWELVSEGGETELVDETSIESVVDDRLRPWYFPAHAPELNPVEARGTNSTPGSTSDSSRILSSSNGC